MSRQGIVQAADALGQGVKSLGKYINELVPPVEEEVQVQSTHIHCRLAAALRTGRCAMRVSPLTTPSTSQYASTHPASIVVAAEHNYCDA